MAEKSMPDISERALKEALQAQQLLLQKLYAELDQEREASATAASESLSMILRLQGEKAAVEMEASQYKRLVEEKMCHAEETLAIFEDLIYQKEMEISALEFQMQAYRCKLLSLGFDDTGIAVISEGSGNDEANKGGKINYLPPLLLKDLYGKMGATQREKSPNAVAGLMAKIVDESMNKECKVFGINFENKYDGSTVRTFSSYGEQIKKLDERVKQLSGCNDLQNGSGSSSLQSPTSTSSEGDVTMDNLKNLPDTDVSVDLAYSSSENSGCCSSIQDIFEVPLVIEKLKGCGLEKVEQEKLVWDGGQKRLEKPDITSLEDANFQGKEDNGWVKKSFGIVNEKKSPTDQYNWDLVKPKVGIAETRYEIQQLRRRIEQLENEREGSLKQDTAMERGERFKLLKEIQQQLVSIQSEMESRGIKSSTTSDESGVYCLREALSCFWP